MKFSLHCAIALIGIAAARLGRLPYLPELTQVQRRSTADRILQSKSKRLLYDFAQSPLDDVTSRAIRLPIETLPSTDTDAWPWPIFMTTVALGTPPQPFMVILDIGWSGLVVKSPACRMEGFWGVWEDCDNIWFNENVTTRYNGSLSSTNKSLKERGVTRCPDRLLCGKIEGNLSTDSLQVSSARVPEVPFGEIEFFEGNEIVSFNELSDGYIGFGPPNATSHTWNSSGDSPQPLEHPNGLHTILHHGNFSHKVLKLRLPEGRNSYGELVIGEEAPASDFVVPLSKDHVPGLEESWKVQINSIQLHGDVPANISLTNVHAGLTLMPLLGLALPRHIAYYIWGYTGAISTVDWPGDGHDSDDYLGFWGARIDCQRRHLLPDLVISFPGKDLVLTWEYYTTMYPFENSPIFGACFVEITVNQDNDHTAYIGLRILTRFDIAFDLDRSEIGFKTIR